MIQCALLFLFPNISSLISPSLNVSCAPPIAPVAYTPVLFTLLYHNIHCCFFGLVETSILLIFIFFLVHSSDMLSSKKTLQGSVGPPGAVPMIIVSAWALELALDTVMPQCKCLVHLTLCISGSFVSLLWVLFASDSSFPVFCVGFPAAQLCKDRQTLSKHLFYALSEHLRLSAAV